MVGRKYPVTWRIYGRYTLRTWPYVGLLPCGENLSSCVILGGEDEEGLPPDMAKATQPLAPKGCVRSCFASKKRLFTTVYSTRRDRTTRDTQKSLEIYFFPSFFYKPELYSEDDACARYKSYRPREFDTGRREWKLNIRSCFVYLTTKSLSLRTEVLGERFVNESSGRTR